MTRLRIATAASLILVCFLFGMNSTEVARLTKGPYLIYPGLNTTMQVLWQFDGAQTATLEWGLDAAVDDDAQVSTTRDDNQIHRVTLDNLQPGELYHYRLTWNGGTRKGTFRAAPAEDEDAVKFMVFGDTRTQVSSFNDVSQAMVDTATKDPAFQSLVLHVGDWVADGTEEAWANEYFSQNAPGARALTASIPVNGVRGNHEGDGKVYQRYFPYPYVGGRGYWSFDYGPVHFTIIDQFETKNGPSREQLRWVERDLATTTQPWKIMLYHAPAYSAGGHEPDVVAMKVLHPLAVRYSVDVSFLGHNHYYARTKVQNVHHVTVGGGGAPLKAPDLSQPHLVTAAKAFSFAKVEVQGQRLTVSVEDLDGNSIDSFTVTRAATNQRQESLVASR